MLRIFLERLQSPIGEMIVGVDEASALRILDFTDYEARMRKLLDRQYGKGKVVLAQARKASEAGRVLARYFKGDLDAIKGIKTANSGTDFQRKVWKALRAIPAGRTTSYGALAASLSLPQAARAVGLANGANPIAIVVPCHRVVGSDGSLTGYGGGIHRKEWLLAHEAAR
ncbi:MAG TPA: methylated-DNA--[protein]-cysteine S-methyltransferase [Rhizomicrobium sp.]|nr:methylated-DNA--[protein]-cysteine S-methyltransferase [Rhizomicrobium sp.]